MFTLILFSFIFVGLFYIMGTNFLHKYELEIISLILSHHSLSPWWNSRHKCLESAAIRASVFTAAPSFPCRL